MTFEGGDTNFNLHVQFRLLIAFDRDILWSFGSLGINFRIDCMKMPFYKGLLCDNCAENPI